MRFVSAFAGVGGFDLGLERAGWECAAQIEKDEACTKVLERHWPDVPRFTDIKEVKGGDLLALGPVDLLCGGFPCTDVSVAGRRAGLAGDESGLFFEFARLAEEARPRWLLVENVPGLLSSNDGRDMGTVLGTLAELGYWWAYRCLDSQHFGLPQRRMRVFVVAGLGDRAGPAQVLLEPESRPGDSRPRRAPEEATPASPAGSLGGCCAVDGCGKPIKAKGLCGNHYERLRTRGTLEPHEWPLPTSCKAPDCDRRGEKRGWCNTHYQRWRTKGDARENDRVCSGTLEERLWARVRVTDDCWWWEGATDNGYGLIGVGQQTKRVHRIVYELLVGPIPKDRPDLDHLCRNRACVRPDHLEPVTNAENVRRGVLARRGDLPDVASTLGGGSAGGGRRQDTDRMTFVPETAYALQARDGRHGVSQREGQTSLIAYSMRADAMREGVAKTPSADAEGRVRLRDPGMGVYEEMAPTLDTGQPHGVAHAFSVYPEHGQGADLRATEIDGPAPALTAEGIVRVSDRGTFVTQGWTVHGEHSTAMAGDGEAEVAFETERVRCLDSSGGYATNQGGTLVSEDEGYVPETAPTMPAFGGPRGTTNNPQFNDSTVVVVPEAVAYQCQGSNVGEMGTLRAGNGHTTGGVPFTVVDTEEAYPLAVGRGGKGVIEMGDEGTYNTLRAGDGSSSRQPLVALRQSEDACAFSENQRAEVLETDFARQMTAGGGKPGQGYPAVRQGMVVRRLTPTETNRLQGFPDGWNDNVADSHRYRQMGNAVSVPVAYWIGRRLAAVHLQQRGSDEGDGT